MRMQFTAVLASAVLAVVAPLTAASQTIKTVIPFAQPVSGVTNNPLTNLVYVVAPSFGGATDNLAVIDGRTDTLKGNIVVPAGAYLPVVNILTNRIYIASCNTNLTPAPCFVTVVDATRNRVITTIPVTSTPGNGLLGITVNPITNTVYVSNDSDKVIDIINGWTNKVTGTIAIPSGTPSLLTINYINNRLYVPLGNNELDVIDAGKKTILATTTYGSNLSVAAVNLVTGNVFVTDTVFGPSTTGVFDKNGAVLASVPVGDTPFGVDVDPFTNLAFVASTALNTVTVIDGRTNTVKATVFGVVANFVSVNFVSEKVYLTGNNGVTVLTEK